MSSQSLQFKSRDFSYSGAIDDSKSIVNRLLILRSHTEKGRFFYKSRADDVVFLDRSLNDLENGKKEFDIGSGGTSLRFFLARLSRQPGRYSVSAHPRLLSRPQADLYRALRDVGTNISLRNSSLIDVNVLGWEGVSEVHVKSDVSSQYASAFLLNSWNLKKEFTIHLGSKVASRTFLELTKTVCQKTGMEFKSEGNKLLITPNQKVDPLLLTAEVDSSSLFTLACFGVLFGEAHIYPASNQFGQPDFQFLELFKKWNLKYSLNETGFKVSKQLRPSSVAVDIGECPDLFPVLCAFLSFCDGRHKVYGAPHLKDKESDRLEKVYELLQRAGVPVTRLADGLEIHGDGNLRPKAFLFDPDHDHRMAFAAAVFAYAGFEIELTDTSVVTKSFPQFWSILGLKNG